MKITLQHLGPIEQAEIDLRPLTVFIGRNNTGKTWATQAIGAMFGSTMHEAYAFLYATQKIPDTYPLLDKVVEQIIQEGNAQLDWFQVVEELSETLFTNLRDFTRQNLERFIGTELVSFNQFEMNFDFTDIKPKLRDYGFKSTINISRNLLKFITEQDSNRLYFFKTTTEPILNKLPKQEIKDFVINVILVLICRTFYSAVMMFPTERPTITTFSLHLRGNSWSDEEQASPPELPIKIPTAVNLFSVMLKLISETNLTERKAEIKDNPQIAIYIELASFLEMNVLGGEIHIAEFKLGLQKELVFQTNGINLEVSASSSMTKELAPLVLYLRYLAQPGELIIIDEPEMNLHPQAQAELMEFLAMLVNAGLHVLITTHSPYMVDHLANLMAAAKHEDKTAIKEHFLLERTESFISQDKVSVYLFENGTATNVVDDNGIIRWGTFGEVSNYLSDVYTHLI